MKPSITARRYGYRTILLASVLGISLPTQAARPPLVIMGDSIAEGVQAADAAYQTQIHTFGNWLAHQMGHELIIPRIATSPLGVVNDTHFRRRIDPRAIGTNVGSAGADVGDVLNRAATAVNPRQIRTEADLIMYPRRQTQLGYVESALPTLVVCWIGSNDALGTVMDYSSLDASQLTPLDKFRRNYQELASRLGNLVEKEGTRVVFLNIPDVTRIGFLLNRGQVEQFLGHPLGAELLPDGHYTTLAAAILMALAGNTDLLQDPEFVLDALEVATISQRIQDYNAIIAAEAAGIGMPVVDINAWLNGQITSPTTFYGIPLGTGPLRGIFSLDTVHPSNITHALIANEIIKVMNDAFGTGYPEIAQQVLNLVFLLDPSIDKDDDGRVRGRPGVGLLESLALLVGITGDPSDRP